MQEQQPLEAVFLASEHYKPLPSSTAIHGGHLIPQPQTYHLYKRRFFGLLGICLLNISTAINWLLFSAVSQECAEFYDVSLTGVNWLSTIVCGLYIVLFAVVPIVTDRYSCRTSCLISASLTLIGVWMRYASAATLHLGDEKPRSGYFALLFIGTVFIGCAQPFVQIIATVYSEIWFSAQGRTVCTTLIAISNPFGGALASVIGPLVVVNGARDIPKLLLVSAIITSCITPTAMLVGARPPSPPSPAATVTEREGIWKTISVLSTVRSGNRSALDLLVIFICFSAFMSAFDATTTFLSQIFRPEGYSDDASGYFGAAMVVAGLVAAGITAPILDRSRLNRKFALIAKFLTPVIAICYIGLIFAAKPNDYAGIYVLMIIIGAFSFVLLFIALELTADLSFDLGVLPDSPAALLYLGGNAFSVVFIVAMDALRDSGGSMRRALVFQAVVVAIFCSTIFLLSSRQARKEMEDTAFAANTAKIPLQAVKREASL